MNNIIWNSLWSCEDWYNKNYVYFINEIFKKIWVRRVKNDILFKNHKFIELLSIVDFDINSDIEAQLYKLWFNYKWNFWDETNDFNNFLEKNKKDIKSWNILFGFIYDGMKISHIIFASQFVESDYVENLIEENKRAILQCIADNNININI